MTGSRSRNILHRRLDFIVGEHIFPSKCFLGIDLEDAPSLPDLCLLE
jgi:hypothetical protein